MRKKKTKGKERVLLDVFFLEAEHSIFFSLTQNKKEEEEGL